MWRNHPRGLLFILLTEMWERVGFYSLMAVLVLYMENVLKWPDSRKGDYYSWFIGLCYFMPLAGGWLGDRLLGRLRTVQTGAVLMILGYIGLALSSPWQLYTFYAGLLFVAAGTGIFKVNMSVLVGNLYASRPGMKDAGFNIFYMGVNVGASIAPLLATYIMVNYQNYNLIFWICAAGLLAGLAVFRAGRPYLAEAGQAVPATPAFTVKDSGSPPVMSPKEERQRLAALITLFLVVIFFWVAYYQNYFAMTLFADRSVQVYTWLRPETYQFFPAFFILVLTPPLLALFSWMRKRKKEPATPLKIFSGILIMGLSMLIMVTASLAGGNADNQQLSPAWLISTYFFVTLAEVLISPMGQSYVSKVAPPRLQGLMMGGWYCATAIGSYGSGFMGKYYSQYPHHQYFLLLAGLLLVSAALVLLFLRRLRQFAG